MRSLKGKIMFNVTIHFLFLINRIEWLKEKNKMFSNKTQFFFSVTYRRTWVIYPFNESITS